MNLTTRCPNCGTAFRVQPVQLSARGGKVRCGKCTHVFDGVAALVAEGGQGGPQAEIEPSPQLALFAASRKSPVAGAGEAANEDAPVVDFLEDVPPPRRSRSLAFAIVLLLISLAAQVTHYFRTEIAAMVPETRPYLAQACAMLGCDLRLPRYLKQVTIESSELRATGSAEGIVEVDASIRNQSPYVLEYPSLILTLTNANDEILAARVITPSEYLQNMNPVAIRAGILPRSVTETRVYFDNRKLQAIGYRLALVYM